MSSHARDFCIDCDRLADGLRRDHEAQIETVKKLAVEMVEKARAEAFEAGQKEMRERVAQEIGAASQVQWNHANDDESVGDCESSESYEHAAMILEDTEKKCRALPIGKK